MLPLGNAFDAAVAEAAALDVVEMSADSEADLSSFNAAYVGSGAGPDATAATVSKDIGATRSAFYYSYPPPLSPLPQSSSHQIPVPEGGLVPHKLPPPLPNDGSNHLAQLFPQHLPFPPSAIIEGECPPPLLPERDSMSLSSWSNSQASLTIAGFYGSHAHEPSALTVETGLKQAGRGGRSALLPLGATTFPEGAREYTPSSILGHASDRQSQLMNQINAGSSLGGAPTACQRSTSSLAACCGDNGGGMMSSPGSGCSQVVPYPTTPAVGEAGLPGTPSWRGTQKKCVSDDSSPAPISSINILTLALGGGASGVDQQPCGMSGIAFGGIINTLSRATDASGGSAASSAFSLGIACVLPEEVARRLGVVASDLSPPAF